MSIPHLEDSGSFDLNGDIGPARTSVEELFADQISGLSPAAILRTSSLDFEIKAKDALS